MNKIEPSSIFKHNCTLALPLLDELHDNPHLERSFVGLNRVFNNQNDFKNYRLIYTKDENIAHQLANHLIEQGILNNSTGINSIITGKAKFPIINSSIKVNIISYNESDISKAYRQILIYEQLVTLMTRENITRLIPSFFNYEKMIKKRISLHQNNLSHELVLNPIEKLELARNLVLKDQLINLQSFAISGLNSYYANYENYHLSVVGQGEAQVKLPGNISRSIKNIILYPGITHISIENVKSVERLVLSPTIKSIGQLPKQIEILSKIPRDNQEILSALSKSKVRKLMMVEN